MEDVQLSLTATAVSATLKRELPTLTLNAREQCEIGVPAELNTN
jgi:hypothetical protein